MSSISWFDIISVAVPDAKIATANSDVINKLLANGLIYFLLIVNQFLVMDQEVYQEVFLDNWVFDKTWYQLINNLQKLQKDLQLVY